MCINLLLEDAAVLFFTSTVVSMIAAIATTVTMTPTDTTTPTEASITGDLVTAEEASTIRDLDRASNSTSGRKGGVDGDTVDGAAVHGKNIVISCIPSCV